MIIQGKYLGILNILIYDIKHFKYYSDIQRNHLDYQRYPPQCFLVTCNQFDFFVFVFDPVFAGSYKIWFDSALGTGSGSTWYMAWTACSMAYILPWTHGARNGLRAVGKGISLARPLQMACSLVSCGWRRGTRSMAQMNLAWLIRIRTLFVPGALRTAVTTMSGTFL